MTVHEAVVRPAPGRELLERLDGIRRVYVDAFSPEPWGEGPADAETYLGRLAGDVGRPGFAAALALAGDRVLGFATAWTSETPLPADRSYPKVTAALGAARTEAWLCGGLEVDELAVTPAAHGRGLGRALLRTVTADAPEGRCWLLTAPEAAATVAFYRREGWHQVTRPAHAGELAVFLGPHHPARPR